MGIQLINFWVSSFEHFTFLLFSPKLIVLIRNLSLAVSPPVTRASVIRCNGPIEKRIPRDMEDGRQVGSNHYSFSATKDLFVCVCARADCTSGAARQHSEQRGFPCHAASRQSWLRLCGAQSDARTRAKGEMPFARPRGCLGAAGCRPRATFPHRSWMKSGGLGDLRRARLKK